MFTWSGGPRSSGVGFFCFHALEDTKQKKSTPLDRGPPLHVNRVLVFNTLESAVVSCLFYPSLVLSVRYSVYAKKKAIRIQYGIIKRKKCTSHSDLMTKKCFHRELKKYILSFYILELYIGCTPLYFMVIYSSLSDLPSHSHGQFFCFKSMNK